KTRPLYRFEYSRLDGLLRCWLLRNALSSTATPNLSDFIDSIESLERLPTKDTSTSQRGRREKERRNKTIGALFPIYLGRLDVIRTAIQGNPIPQQQIKALGAIAAQPYDFDYDHYSLYLREMAARSVSRLLIIRDIDERELISRATDLIRGKFQDPFASRRIHLWELLSL